MVPPMVLPVGVEESLRRLVSFGSIVVAVVVLGLVLYNATLVDRRPPAVREVSLSATVAGDDRLAQTVTAIDISFSEPVDHASAEARIRIVPEVDGAFTWDGSTAIFTPSQPLPLDVEFEVSVQPGIRDLAGNASTTGLDSWVFRSVGAPRVLAIEPVDGATELAVDTPIVIRFDRLMDTASVERAIRLDPPVAARPSWSGDTLTLSAVDRFRFGTTYTITIGGQASDTGGNPLGVPFSTRFSTVRAGVHVERTVPADAVSGIGVTTPIAVVFDGPIDPATIAGALAFDPPVDGAPEVVALPSDHGSADPTSVPDPSTLRVLRFTPSSPLAAHTTYQVTLAPVVARLGDPGQVAPGRSWTFTTGSPSPSAQNQIGFLSARSGVRSVWLMNPDGSNQRQLTTTLAPLSGYDVSSDGSLIAYAAAGVVWVMAIDGSARSQVTRAGVIESAPRFLPDGRSLVIGRRDASGADLGYWRVPVPGVLVGAEPEIQLLAGGAPPLGSVALHGDGRTDGPGTTAWSTRTTFDPTGRWILLVTGAGDVRLIDMAPGTGTAPVSSEIALIGDGPPVWVADRGAFAVVAREPASQAVSAWLVDTDGAIVRLAAAVGSIAVSSEGALAFATPAPATGTTRVVVLGPSGGEPQQVTTAPRTADERWPRFAPGGGSIVFGRVGTVGQDDTDGIWMVRLPGGEETRLTTDGAHPAWLP